MEKEHLAFQILNVSLFFAILDGETNRFSERNKTRGFHGGTPQKSSAAALSGCQVQQLLLRLSVFVVRMFVPTSRGKKVLLFSCMGQQLLDLSLELKPKILPALAPHGLQASWAM